MKPSCGGRRPRAQRLVRAFLNVVAAESVKARLLVPRVGGRRLGGLRLVSERRQMAECTYRHRLFAGRNPVRDKRLKPARWHAVNSALCEVGFSAQSGRKAALRDRMSGTFRPIASF
jgi:hypothetical protein